MRKFVLWISLLFSGTIIAQNQIISGFIKDHARGEALINANVYTNTLKQISISDNYGFFSINTGSDADSLYFSYVGYKRKGIAIKTLKETSNITITLDESTTLDEVKVSAKSMVEEVRNHQLGVNRLNMKDVENLPTVLGEPDILRVLKNMPGVQNGTAGTAGLFVRGTGPGQCLILLDGVPIYNVNHLYGFYSVFNSDAINSATLYKGGFPARYGGRSSAFLDISMLEGRNDKIGVKGSIGVAATHLLIEGPIVKDKLTFLVSGRRTYSDYITNTITNISSPDPENRMSQGFYFYDATAKLNYKINKRQQLFMSFYGGKDNLSIDKKENTDAVKNYSVYDLTWGNLTGSLRYNYSDNYGGFSNAQVYVSEYKYSDQDEASYYSKELEQFTSVGKDDFSSKIRDIGVNYSYDKSFNTLNIRTGLGLINHNFIPSEGSMTRFEIVNAEPTFIDTSYSQGITKLTEAFYFLENNWKISPKWTANVGIRIVNQNIEKKAIELEPRLQLQYLLNDFISFKTAYTRLTQNSFLIETNSIMSPADLWVIKTDDMKPIIANQIDFGVNTALWNEIKLSFETYYKKLDNVFGYREGSKFDKLNSWNANIVQGKGEAYGFETMVERKQGKVSGWVSYTLAYSNRLFEEQNAGKPYRYKYDNRHSLSIVGKYQINKQFSFNAQWNYSSGSFISVYTHKTYAIYKFQNIEGVDGYFGGNSLYASGKNNHQMPAYHQLDIGFTYTKQKKRALIKWNYGIYNVYNHVNPFYITQTDEGTKLHGYLPILPYVSYSFEF